MIPSRLTRMTRVEVVVDAADVPAVESLLRAEGVSGWTSLSGLSGVGHHGRHEGRLLFNETSGQVLLLTVLPEDRLEPVVAGIEALLSSRPGVMFVSETYVSRPGYFGAASGS
jgi:nitrogen regulatory protein PII